MVTPITPCADCHKLTVQLQRRSLGSATRWLLEFAFSDFDSDAAPPLPGDIVLSRSIPACDELGCEAPVRRDGRVRVVATSRIQSLFNAGWQWWPEIQAPFIAGAARWAEAHAHVAEHAVLTFGPASCHAALIANNLVHAAQRADQQCPSVPDNIEVATEPSLDEIERRLITSSPGDAKITAGDLIVIHLLNHGVRKAIEYAVKYPEPEPVVRTVPRPRWLLPVCITLMAAAVLGTAWLRLPAVALLSVPAIAALIFVREGTETLPAPPGLAWPKNLAKSAEQSEHRKLLGRFESCDLLDRARDLFDSTRIGNPEATARLLRAIHSTPGAPMVMNRLIHDLTGPLRHQAANPSEAAAVTPDPYALRVAALGEQLLENDGASHGAEVAAALLTELRQSPMPNAEESGLWHRLASQVAACGPEHDESNLAGFPRFFVKLMRRAAGLREGRTMWSAGERLVLERCAEAARAWLGRPPLNHPDWQLWVVRCAWHFLEPGFEAVRLPPHSNCNLASLCARVEEISDAHFKNEDSDPVKSEAQFVTNLPGFLRANTRLSSLDALREEEMFRRNDGPSLLDAYLSQHHHRLFGERETVPTRTPAVKPVAPKPRAPAAQPGASATTSAPATKEGPFPLPTEDQLRLDTWQAKQQARALIKAPPSRPAKAVITSHKRKGKHRHT